MAKDKVTPEEVKVIGRAGVKVFPPPQERDDWLRLNKPLKYAIRLVEPGSMQDLASWRLRRKLRKK